MLAAVRNFVVGFLIAALVFGTIAYFITDFIAENIIGIAESPEETTGDSVDVGDEPEDSTADTFLPDDPTYDYPDLQGESFNILLIGTDYRPDYFDDYIEDIKKSPATLGLLTTPIRTRNADLMMLISVSEETRTITFTCIPAATRVSVNGDYRLLNSVYDKYGVETIVSFVNYLTATPIDYYIAANITEAGKILNLIDGVTVNVPTDIYNPYYKLDRAPDMPGYNRSTKIMIPAGSAEINSSNLFALLHYRTSKITSGEHEAVLSELARATLKKATSEKYLSNAADLFERALTYTTTNMKVSDLTDNLGIFRAYEEFTVSTITYPGTYSTLGDEACFIPDTNAAYEIFRALNEATRENKK